MRSGLALALVLATACGDTTPATIPAVTVSPAPPVAASAIATASAKRVEVSDTSIRTRMLEVGVSVVLPPEVEPVYDDVYKRYVFRVSMDEGMIELVEGAAPKTDEDAKALWSADLGRDEARLLEHGGGGLEPWWSVTSFKVRMGVPGRPGLHRIQRVSRVAGVLALPGGRHARCSLALEYDVEGSLRPPSLDEAISLCRSLRPLQ